MTAASSSYPPHVIKAEHAGRSRVIRAEHARGLDDLPATQSTPQPSLPELRTGPSQCGCLWTGVSAANEPEARTQRQRRMGQLDARGDASQSWVLSCGAGGGLGGRLPVAEVQTQRARLRSHLSLAQ